jgi:ADP-ribose pyrophosphatase YjhB (NUDIX family)
LADIAVASGQLNYRVAGVCIERGHVLLHTEDRDDFWVLPGGRPRLHETSRDALAREMDEELGVRVAVERLLWVVENVFTYRGRRLHELALYYAMSLPEDSPYRDVGTDFSGHEGETTLHYRWFPIDGLGNANLRPTFLETALSELPETPRHIVHVDPEPEPEI